MEMYSDKISFDSARQLCRQSSMDDHSGATLSTSMNPFTKLLSHHCIVLKCKRSRELLWEGDIEWRDFVWYRDILATWCLARWDQGF